MNIALEGLMLAGAFTAAAVTFYMHSPWAGLGAAMLAGALFALLLAVACIRFKANEVVAGTGINILFLGLPAVLSGALFLSSGSTPQVPKEELLPTVSQLLSTGLQWRILTDVSVVSLLALFVVGLTSYVLYSTPFGLRLRSVGENPEAADAAGVRVNRIRYIGVVLSGVLAGVGGAYLSIGQSSLFTRNMTAGRGFIALAALDLRQMASRPDDARLRALWLRGRADDSDAGCRQAAVRRRRARPVHSDDSVRGHHRRAGGLHRPVARARRARRAIR